MEKRNRDILENQREVSDLLSVRSPNTNKPPLKISGGLFFIIEQSTIKHSFCLDKP